MIKTWDDQNGRGDMAIMDMAIMDMAIMDGRGNGKLDKGVPKSFNCDAATNKSECKNAH